MTNSTHWPTYYARVAGREPRALLVRVLASFEAELDPTAPRQAIDLGCGDGTETAVMIARGWRVLAIDREPESRRRVIARIPPEQEGLLEVQTASFEEARLVPAHLVYAGLSLPFCAPQHFAAVWRSITAAMVPGGRFAGHLFGDRDGWAAQPGMTCLARPLAEALFAGFEVEVFEESEEDAPTALGEHKHWHIYKVIARKPG